MNLHIDFAPAKILAFVAFFLLGYGYLYRCRRGHAASIAGWTLLAMYWLTQIPVFLGEREPMNAGYAVLAQPFFLFLAYHEWLNMKWKEDYSSLRFMAGVAAIAGTMYFIIHTFEDVAAFFIREAAHETVVVLKYLAGMDVAVEPTTFKNGIVRVPISGEIPEGTSRIAIILACTALQSIVIFIAAVVCSRGDRHRRFKAFMATVPVVWILNLVRNVAVVYLVYNDIVDFPMAHDWFSRWGSLIVLIILAFIMFEILPELHEDIVGIAYLYRRRKKGDAAVLWEEVVNPKKKRGEETEEVMGGETGEEKKEETGEKTGGETGGEKGEGIEGDKKEEAADEKVEEVGGDKGEEVEGDKGEGEVKVDEEVEAPEAGREKSEDAEAIFRGRPRKKQQESRG